MKGSFNPGDVLRMPVIAERKWWQIWKPSFKIDRFETYTISAVVNHQGERLHLHDCEGRFIGAFSSKPSR